MADLVEAFLRKSPATPKQRAELWDAFEESNSEDELAERISAIGVPKHVKAGLWDLKVSSKTNDLSTPEPTPRRPDAELVPSAMGFGSSDVLKVLPDMVGRGAMGVLRGLNPKNIVGGIAQVASDQVQGMANLDPNALIPGGPTAAKMAQASVGRLGEAARLAGEGEYLAATGQLGAAIPGVGEAAAELGERTAETGDVAGAVGEVAGNVLVPKVYGAALRGTAAGTRKIAPIAKGFAVRKAPLIGTAVGGAVGGGAGAVLGRELGESVQRAARAKSIAAAQAESSAVKAAEAAKAESLATAEKAAKAEADAARSAAREAAEKEKYRGVTKKEFETLRQHDEALRMNAKLDKGKTARINHVLKQTEKAVSDEAGASQSTAKMSPKAKAAKESFEAKKTDLEGQLEASLNRGKDVVEAKPAFPGQQGAKGATKARFEDVQKRLEAAKRLKEANPQSIADEVIDLDGQGRSVSEIRTHLAEKYGMSAKESGQILSILKKGSE